MRNSKYWDNFQKRADTTVKCVKECRPVPVERVAIFVTNRCNFRCKYCNVAFNTKELSQLQMIGVLEQFGTSPIYHITGGEPSVVKWLYPFLEANGERFTFHLNTNGFITPPAARVKRLKISLEGVDETWDRMVNYPGAFQKVVDNIKKSIPLTTVSITYTLSRATYRQSVDFARFARREFPELYATFFSVYKGKNPEFAWDEESSREFFEDILPTLRGELDEESRNLIDETLDEKRRLIQGVRFPGNCDMTKPCYLSMSERVVSPDGQISTCSHLYRDGIFQTGFEKHEKCRYGCNQRLVMFNDEVERKLER